MAFSLFKSINTLCKATYLVCGILYIGAWFTDYWAEYPNGGHAGLWTQCGVWIVQNATNSSMVRVNTEVPDTTTRTYTTPRDRYRFRTWYTTEPSATLTTMTTTTVQDTLKDDIMMKDPDTLNTDSGPYNGTSVKECRFFNLFHTPGYIHVTRILWLCALLGLVNPLIYKDKTIRNSPFSFYDASKKWKCCWFWMVAILSVISARAAVNYYEQEYKFTHHYGPEATPGSGLLLALWSFILALITLALFFTPVGLHKFLSQERFDALDKDPLGELKKCFGHSPARDPDPAPAVADESSDRNGQANSYVTARFSSVHSSEESLAIFISQTDDDQNNNLPSRPSISRSFHDVSSPSDPASRYAELTFPEAENNSDLPPPPSYDECIRGSYLTLPSENNRVQLSPLIMPLAPSLEDSLAEPSVPPGSSMHYGNYESNFHDSQDAPCSPPPSYDQLHGNS